MQIGSYAISTGLGDAKASAYTPDSGPPTPKLSLLPSLSSADFLSFLVTSCDFSFFVFRIL